MNGEIAGPFTTQLVLSTRLMAEINDASSRLSAVAQRNQSAVIVHAGGEVDAFNQHTWRGLIVEAAAAARAPGPFVVDVNGFEFLGCCAFGVLADEARRCQRRGITLLLAGPEQRVTRYVEACGFAGVLPVHPTASAALSAGA